MSDRIKVPITPDDPICVDKKPYLDPETIPGNEPKPLLDSGGKPVLGPDQAPVYGPSRGINNLDKIKEKLDSDGLFSRPGDKAKLKTGGEWDYQRIHDDDGSIIFIKRYRDFANVTIGYGEGEKEASQDAQSYTAGRNLYRKWVEGKPPLFEGEPKDPAYPALPKALTDDYKIGDRLRVLGIQKKPSGPQK